MGLIQIAKQEKTEAVTVRLPISVVQRLRDYMGFLGTESTAETIGAMIRYVTSKDKDYQQWKKGGRDEDL